MNQKYKCVTVGGTFDHLHKGHLYLLDHAFQVSEKVRIALTTDEFVRGKSLSQSIQSYDVRKKQLEDYLQRRLFATRAEIISINNEFGFAPVNPQLDGIVVTEETKGNALKINDLRQKNNLPPLEIVIVPFVSGIDNQQITSSRIRAGEIDRGGFTYSALFKDKTLHLPEFLRESLRIPFGKVVSTTSEVEKLLVEYKPTLVITVGDIVAMELEKNNLSMSIKVVDYKTQRRSLETVAGTSERQFINKPGTIEHGAAEILQKQIHNFLEQKNSTQITINGEEDLLVIPAVLLAPLNAVVLYGQHGLGVVVVQVTEEKKSQVRKIVEQFTPSTTD